MLVQNALGVSISVWEWLTNDGSLQFCAASGRVPNPLKRRLESALAKTREVVAGGPEDVRIGEKEFGLTVLLPAVIREGFVAILVGIGA